MPGFKFARLKKHRFPFCARARRKNTYTHIRLVTPLAPARPNVPPPSNASEHRLALSTRVACHEVCYTSTSVMGANQTPPQSLTRDFSLVGIEMEREGEDA